MRAGGGEAVTVQHRWLNDRFTSEVKVTDGAGRTATWTDTTPANPCDEAWTLDPKLY